MMSNKLSFMALCVALLALVISFMGGRSEKTEAAAKEPAFERVMKSRILRCAYIPRSHFFETEAASGNKSGIDYEIVEALAKLLHLKIEWAVETGYGSFPEELRSGKADALCSTVWGSASRAARVIYTTPTLYAPLYVYTRDGDTRFDGNLAFIDAPKTVITVIDDSTTAAVATISFPKAKKDSMPQLTDAGTMIVNVVTNKGDLTFLDTLTASDYNKANPDKKIRRAQGLPPVRTYAEAYSVALGEWSLREFLNAGLNELHNNGTIERILAKYENEPGEIKRVVMPSMLSALRSAP